MLESVNLFLIIVIKEFLVLTITAECIVADKLTVKKKGIQEIIVHPIPKGAKNVGNMPLVVEGSTASLMKKNVNIV